MMTDGTFNGSQVFPEEAVHRLQAGRVNTQTYLNDTDEQYGFGWMRQPLLDDEVVGHGGSILISTAYIGFLENAGLGVAVACNTSAEPVPGELGQATLAIAHGHDSTAVPAFALKEKCEAVTGTYRSFRGKDFTATVEWDSGALSISTAGPMMDADHSAFPTSLDPDEYTFYTVTGGGARIPVEFDLEGDQDDLFFRRYRLRRTGSSE